LNKTSPTFMSGVPELLVLRLLAQREMYGYELSQEIVKVTRAAIAVGEGALYPALHGLQERGFLRSRHKAVAGRTRVYYQVTHKGQQRLDVLTQEWRRVAGGVEAVLLGAAHAK
jgi:PadR family transcriptional regulator PadR